MTTQTKNSKLVSQFGKNAKDTGSVDVQIAILTQRIADLSPHVEKNTFDQSSKRGLMKIIGNRRRLLKYLKSQDENRYQKVIDGLGLRK
ncbi:MAG: 30S ribosomal protein S15 [Bacteriovoracaceae bacterium]|nr:30S ribosomal protein S15 [Bacteriovoracaceae bacterium]